jgi:ATP-dependent helicase/nuclease subunit B
MIAAKSISRQEAWQMLNQGATIATVNRRLARYLTSCFTRHQLESGQIVWETPDILPFASWLQRLYGQGIGAAHAKGKSSLPVLLSPSQESRVWENIIGQSSYGTGLLQIPETAKIAGNAWEIVTSWRLPVDDLSRYASEDGVAFLSWMEQFQSRCTEKGWLDNARLGDAVAEIFNSKLILPKEHIILAGFDELTPRQKMIMDAAISSGAKAYALEQTPRNRQQARTAFADMESELTAAAYWAEKHLESDTNCRIGIIVPDLAQARQKVIRVFDDVFHPSHVASSKNPPHRIYNISLGQPLSRYSIIQDALLFLHMAIDTNVSCDQYSQMLRSPYWAGAEIEAAKRAMFDADIRRIGDLMIPFRRFLEIAQKISSRNPDGRERLPALLERVRQFNRLVEQMPETQKPSIWAREFTNLLNAIGWPGERTLDSDEFQTAAAWREALHKFAEMDTVVHELNLASAFTDFKRLVDDTIFQPETADVPVQVMGLLEPTGEQFDHLWVMGLSSEAWPRPPHPNPLLAIEVQRRHHVPHASAQWEYEFARKILQQLVDPSDDVIFSYPVSDGETDLLPSPLIVNIPETPANVIKLRASDEYWSKIYSSLSLEMIEDVLGPQIEDDTTISGGTGLLKAQAACPFSAFAKYRLKAESMEVPVPGLNAAQRGGLVHHALQFIWEILESRSELISRDSSQLGEVVEDAVARAVADQARKQPGAFTDRFAALERERLKNLLIDWLENDKQRSFFTVVQREKKEACIIGGLQLYTIADRIDRLDDGRMVIVDYKTGDVSEKNWFTERMADPQLPLYSVIIQDPVAGVLFARVKKGGFRYFGIADNDEIAPGVKGLAAARKVLPDCESIDDVIDFWREKLESLAIEFKEGQAAVSPVSVHASCRYCDIKPVCRIGEAMNFSLVEADQTDAGAEVDGS